MNHNEPMGGATSSFPRATSCLPASTAARLPFGGGLTLTRSRRQALGRRIPLRVLCGLAVAFPALISTVAWAGPASGGQGESASAASTRGEASPEATETLTEARNEEARQAFREGRELMQEERWAAAAQAFLRAFEIRPTPGLQYYAGYCWEQAGNLVDARASYVAAGELAKALPAADVERLLPDAITRTEAGLGRLELQGGPPGVRLLVDGAEHVASGDLWLLPGQHELRLSASGYVSREFMLRVSRGHSERVDLTLQVEAPKSSPAGPREGEPAAPYDAAPTRRHPGFLPAVLGGGALAVVGLAAGVSGTVIALGARADVRSYGEQVDDLGGDCSDSPTGVLATACDNLSVSARNQETATGVAIGGYAAALVGSTFLVLGLTVWNGQQVRVGALPVNQGGGVLLSGRF